MNERESLCASPKYRSACRQLEHSQAALRENAKTRSRLIDAHYSAIAELDRQADAHRWRLNQAMAEMDSARAAA